jgi:hypothetical protein
MLKSDVEKITFVDYGLGFHGFIKVISPIALTTLSLRGTKQSHGENRPFR